MFGATNNSPLNRAERLVCAAVLSNVHALHNLAGAVCCSQSVSEFKEEFLKLNCCAAVNKSVAMSVL